jgi:hypothetical protein
MKVEVEIAIDLKFIEQKWRSTLNVAAAGLAGRGPSTTKAEKTAPRLKRAGGTRWVPKRPPPDVARKEEVL